jgi:hypothetical protein
VAKERVVPCLYMYDQPSKEKKRILKVGHVQGQEK